MISFSSPFGGGFDLNFDGQCDFKRGGEIRVLPAGTTDVRGVQGRRKGWEGGEVGVLRGDGGQEHGGPFARHQGWEQDRRQLLEASICEIHAPLLSWQCRRFGADAGALH